MKLPGVCSRSRAQARDAPDEVQRQEPRLFAGSLALQSQGEGPPGLQSTKTTAAGKPLQREDFEVLKLLGRGGFAEVKLVRCLRDNQLYAMKAVEKAMLDERRHVGDSRAWERAKAERDIGADACGQRFPFIVQLFAAFQSPQKLYYVFEHCPGGELLGVLVGQPKQRFGEPSAMFYSAEITLALEHLHARDIVHRDVRLENMLLTSDGHVKLADFGCAKAGVSSPFARLSCTLQIGSKTSVFFPPEYLQSEAYGKDLDCWQLGVAAFLMLSGGWPSEGRAWPGGLPAGSSEAAADLCRSLLARERSQRLGFPLGASALRGHAFFAGLSWSALEARDVPTPEVGRSSGRSSSSGSGDLFRPTVHGASNLAVIRGFTFTCSTLLRRSIQAKRLLGLSSCSRAS
mmetsp:Transcript_11605/g.25355  ORF Transcript_11605/g.25355 Transcript_11605/m.25355 type:complete len:402 (-) Transcript_11605:99-1304(-)